MGSSPSQWAKVRHVGPPNSRHETEQYSLRMSVMVTTTQRVLSRGPYFAVDGDKLCLEQPQHMVCTAQQLGLGPSNLCAGH